MKEIKAQKNGKEIILTVKTPGIEEIEDAERIYAAKIANQIRSKSDMKLLSRVELDEFLKDIGVWGDKEIDKSTELQKKVDANLNKLRKGGLKLSEGRRLAIETVEARQELLRLLSKRQMYDSATIESVADTEKNDYLVFSCTVDKETGERYWDSFDDMKNDRNEDVYRQASDGLLEVIYGVGNDLDQNLPEVIWLKKYKFVNSDLRYIDRNTGKFVDKSGKVVEEKEEDLAELTNNLYGELKEEVPFIDDYQTVE